MNIIGEILIINEKKKFKNVWDTLSSQERIFIYYMYNASRMSNIIYSDQIHRHANFLISTIKLLLNSISQTNSFKEELIILYNYLYMNHSQYVVWAVHNEKITPQRLGLKLITIKSLYDNLVNYGHILEAKKLLKVKSSLFDINHESNIVVPNSIEQSACNYYDKGVTNKQILSITNKKIDWINSRVKLNGDVELWCYKDRCRDIFGKIIYNLLRALDITINNPIYFDNYLIKALKYLIIFFYSGDEKYFKKFNINWLKSTNKIDFMFGPIETYHDPLSIRGTFQSEVYIRTTDLDKLVDLIKSIEKQLPFDKKYITTSSKIYNPCIVYQLFGHGASGPIRTCAAYCLPNYDEVRQTIGSKQIIYAPEPSIGERINKEIWIEYTYSKKEQDWFNNYDSEYTLDKWIWIIQCILHETIGHGSGKLDYHKSGVKCTTYNIHTFLRDYTNTIEELRAEILALYVSVYYFDDLIKIGLFDNYKNIPTADLKNRLLTQMCNTGLTRISQQSDRELTDYEINNQIVEIFGDHALANVTIMYYLFRSGGISILHENNVRTIEIKDIHVCYDKIKELAIIIQTIKSTADGDEAEKLIKEYGKFVPLELYQQIKKNNKIITKGLKAIANIPPKLKPVYSNDNIIDITLV
jgi:hypothetical protein